MLNAKLMVVGGDAKPSEIQLRLPTVIGRGRDASLTLPHPLVSRRHTEIFEQDGRLMVRDLGSLNGTFVNNQKIEGDQPLEPNQLLTLGNVTFRAVYDVTDAPESDQLPASRAIELSSNVPQAAKEDATEASPKKSDNQETGPIKSTGSLHDIASKVDPVSNAAYLVANQSVNQENGLSAAEPDTGHVSSALGQDVSESSVSWSSLRGLPDPASSAVELAEPLDVSGQPQASSAIDPAEFQFDESGDPSAIDPNQSDLGSFLKKLPR